MIKRRSARLFAGWNFVRPVSRIDKEQVRRAVIIEIKKRDASAHSLRQQFVAVSAVVVDKINPRGSGDVRKLRQRNFRLRLIGAYWRAQARHLGSPRGRLAVRVPDRAGGD